MPYADRLLVTRIDADFKGDTFFPEVDWSAWTLTENIQGIQDDKNPYEYYFHTYIRNGN
ncbi:Dihydrofolate reductase [compost metagenome]